MTYFFNLLFSLIVGNPCFVFYLMYDREIKFNYTKMKCLDVKKKYNPSFLHACILLLGYDGLASFMISI